MAFIERDVNARWPGGCVPYVIDPQTLGRDATARDIITEAMEHWSTNCDLRFIRRTTQNRYIHFIPDEFPMDGVCSSSSIGMGWAPTYVRLDTTVLQGDRASAVGVTVHEIGHALGFLHEHKRPDRDNFVRINASAINPIYLFNFTIENGEQPVGAYDLGSIMHYGRASAMSLDQNTDLVTTVNPADLSRIGQRVDLSAGDIAAGNTLNQGNMHVMRLSGEGQIASMAQQTNWDAGWTHLSHFSLDLRSFMFRYRGGDGVANIHQIDANGAIPARVQAINLGRGWTSALVYTVGLRKCLLLYNSATGAIELRGINGATGRIDNNPFATANWGRDWSAVHYYQAGLVGDYILFYNQTTGASRVDNLNFDGSLGQNKQVMALSNGWDNSAVYKVGGKNYYFRLKSSTGAMTIRRIGDNGTLGASLQSASWTSGWTMSLPFQAGANSYLFLLKRNSGDVHINRILSNGRIGSIRDVRQFRSGWRIGAAYGVGINTYLVLSQ
jgi:hypothetical protein